MIVFQGELSAKSKEYMLKSYRKKHSRYLFVFSLVSAAVWGFLGFKTNVWILFGSGMGVSLFMMILSFLPNVVYEEKYFNKNNIPNIVTIDDEYIEIEGDVAYSKRKIEDVKSIIETEDFYYFNFYLPYEMNFLCQKDLLVTGSIEEFEERFSYLIKRTDKEKG